MEISASVLVFSVKKSKANLAACPYIPQHFNLAIVIGALSAHGRAMKGQGCPNPKPKLSPQQRPRITIARRGSLIFIVKVSVRFQTQKGQSLSTVNKQEEDNGSSRIKERASIKYASKNEKKKCFIDAYTRKFRDNIWILARSVHVLLQGEHSKDIWEVFITCILLNKTSGEHFIDIWEIFILCILLNKTSGEHFKDIWEVFILCILLNKTSGTQAKKVLQDSFELCPNADAAILVESEEIRKVICFLGIPKKCSEMIQQFPEDYLSEKMHVNDLHGIGKYAADAYAIFCTGHWKDVVPDDSRLNPYWKPFGNLKRLEIVVKMKAWTLSHLYFGFVF